SAGKLLLALAACGYDLREHVRLAQDEHVVGTDLDLRPAVLGEDHLVADRDVHLDVLPVLVTRCGTDGQDLAALRLLLGGVGQHDAARGRGLLVEDLHDDAVTQRLQIHTTLPPCTEFVTTLALPPGECQIDNSTPGTLGQAKLRRPRSHLVTQGRSGVTKSECVVSSPPVSCSCGGCAGAGGLRPSDRRGRRSASGRSRRG